jgi:hypothetical protein
MPNIAATPFLSALNADIQAKYNAKPIKKKSMPQTTGKIQFGGVKEGLIDSYHALFTAGPVNKPPINAAKYDIAMQAINVNNLLGSFFITLFCMILIRISRI